MPQDTPKAPAKPRNELAVALAKAAGGIDFRDGAPPAGACEPFETLRGVILREDKLVHFPDSQFSDSVAEAAKHWIEIVQPVLQGKTALYWRSMPVAVQDTVSQ